MKEAEQLYNLIVQGKSNCAEKYITTLSGDYNNGEYDESLRRIAVIKTAETLCENIPNFYTDTKELARRIFASEISAEEAVALLCKALKEAEKEDKLLLCQKAKNYIEKNFSDNQFSLGEAANYAGLTASALTELFVKNQGITPTEYVCTLRVKMGEMLLEKGNSVGDAASETGFSSAEAFIRAFKKHNGTTPGEWKRNKLFL